MIMKIRARSLDFAFDNCSAFEIVITKMIFADLEDLGWFFTQLGKEEPKKIFLDNLNRFDGKERIFWKLIFDNVIFTVELVTVN
ncbi:MAG: hypothetical protein ACK40Q_07370 [Pseudothermotoga sp.]